MTDADASASQPSFAPTPPKAPDKKARRNTLIQIGIAVAIIIVIFGFVLPQVIDYEQVWETIKNLEAWQLLALLAAGLFLYVPEGWLYKVLVPGISLWKGIKAWVASTAVGSTIPAADLVTRYGMYRSWGTSPEGSMLGILLSGVFDNIVKFSLPVIAVILLGIIGVAAIVRPLPAPTAILNWDFYWMLAITLALIPLFFRGRPRIRRLEGGFLLVVYVAYLPSLVLQRRP